MTIREQTVVPVRTINTVDGTRIDLDDLAGVRSPEQPPPPLAPVGGRQERHVTALVSGRQLAAGAAPGPAVLPG